MANRYEQNCHNHNIHSQKTISLPMFCRLSINDVKQSCHRPNHTPAGGGEPSSPKVSCMGQVKRNNRVTGYPTASANHHKHILITKRNQNLTLSRKSLLPKTTTINPVTTAGADGAGRNKNRKKTTREVIKSRRSQVTNQDCFELVDVAEMDPPLPVVKRVAPPGGGRDEVNIWKRRFNGVGHLKSLKIEKISLPECKFPPPQTLTVRLN